MHNVRLLLSLYGSCADAEPVGKLTPRWPAPGTEVRVWAPWDFTDVTTDRNC